MPVPDPVASNGIVKPGVRLLRISTGIVVFSSCGAHHTGRAPPRLVLPMTGYNQPASSHLDVEKSSQAARAVVDQPAGPGDERAVLHAGVQSAQVQRLKRIELPATEMAVAIVDRVHARERAASIGETRRKLSVRDDERDLVAFTANVTDWAALVGVYRAVVHIARLVETAVVPMVRTARLSRRLNTSLQ